MNEQRNINLNSFQDGENNFNPNSSPKDEPVSQKLNLYQFNF
jgi:hypothetical protein